VADAVKESATNWQLAAAAVVLVLVVVVVLVVAVVEAAALSLAPPPPQAASAIAINDATKQLVPVIFFIEVLCTCVNINKSLAAKCHWT
jgi:hypothetical protein